MRLSDFPFIFVYVFSHLCLLYERWNAKTNSKCWNKEANDLLKIYIYKRTERHKNPISISARTSGAQEEKNYHKYITRCTHSCRATNRFYFDNLLFLHQRHCSLTKTPWRIFSWKYGCILWLESNSYRHVFPNDTWMCAEMPIEKLNGTNRTDAVYQYHTVNASIPYQMNYDYYILAHFSSVCRVYVCAINAEIWNIDHHLRPFCKIDYRNAQIVNIIPTNYIKLTEWRENKQMSKEFCQSVWVEMLTGKLLRKITQRTTLELFNKTFFCCFFYSIQFDFFFEYSS